MAEGMSNEIEEILTDPELFLRITEGELSKVIVKEELTTKAIFLSLCAAFVQGAQVNTLVNSESSAGKSYISRKIFEIMPERIREDYTKISPEALTYLHNSNFEPDWTWNGKILYVEDARKELLDSPTFKVMCSEGSKAAVVINYRTIEIPINGKPCVLLTTASNYIQNEIFNRFNVISLDESVEQTKAIMEREALLDSGENRKKEWQIDENIPEALSKLNRVKVDIPFAPKIVKHFPHTFLRIRRDFGRFRQLIKASCALHQYQRVTFTSISV